MAADSKERRRHTRRATRLRGQVSIGTRESVAGEVLDYSDTGLFVGNLARQLEEAEAGQLVGSPITLTIPLLGRNGGGESRIGGVIAHASPEGIGVDAPDLDDEALFSLHLSANEYGKRKSALSGVGPAAIDRTQTSTLREQCASIFDEFLATVIPDVLRRAGESLGESADSARDGASRTMFVDSAQVLKAQQATLTEAIASRLQRRVRLFGADSETAALIRRSSGLELMGDEDLDDLLAQTTLIAAVEANIVPQLNEFEQRYGRLLNQKVTRQNNPFGLESICQGFRDGVRTLRLPDDARRLFAPALQASLELRIAALYGRLNRALATLRSESLSSAPFTASPSTGSAGGGGASGRANVSAVSGAFPALQSTAISTGGGNPLLADASRSTAAAGIVSAPTPLAQVASDSGRLLDVVGRLDDSARALAQGLGGGAAHIDDMRIAQAAIAEADLGELVRAIDRLSLHELRGPRDGPPGPSVVEQLKARLLDASSGEQRRLSGAIERTLATTSDLVARSLANLIPDSPVDSLLRRLERTLLKVSITDPTFPGWAEHPARQVVNLIDQYAMAADDAGRFFDEKLHRNLNALVDRICERADQDPRVFEVVRNSLIQDLEGIRLARRGRVERLQEALAGRDRIRQSRERVDGALQKRLSGRRLPRNVLRLLDTGLKHYLVLVALRAGPDETEWSDSLHLVDRLFQWFDPSTDPREDGNLLLGDIERQLATVVVDRQELTRITGSLTEVLGAPPGAAADNWDLVAVPQFGDAHKATRDPELPKAISGMRIADWWEFTVDRAKVPMQLIWLGHGGDDFAYTNRSATSKLDVSAADLARRIENGSARPGADLDLPVLDRSEFSLLDETYRSLLARATHERNTGLMNRKGFLHQLSQMSIAANPASSQEHVLCVLEFDQFRLLDQSWGNEATERLAGELAAVVRTYAPADSTVASLRDDSIGVLLAGRTLSDAEAVVADLVRQLSDYRYEFGGRTYRIGVNIGYVSFVPHECTGLDALRRADLAATASHSRGRNASQAYVSDSPDLLSHASLADWAGRADTLLAGGGLFLRCQLVQPVVRTDVQQDKPLPYYEILLGLSHDDASGESPDTQGFIASLEELGRAHEIDRWVLEHVFDWMAANLAALDHVSGLAVNLSAQSIARTDFSAWLRDALAQRGALAHKLVFEITETAAIAGYGIAQEFIREMRRFGCRFALDDFGSGYTSYAHLKNLRTDILKIDGSFVRDMITSESDVAMVKSMSDIAHVLGMKTVAEWVEQPEVLALLAEGGIDYAQGYAIERPFRLELLASRLPTTNAASQDGIGQFDAVAGAAS